MPFNGAATNQQISNATGAMLLLDSSCQAVIEASITPSSSSWYPIVDQELGAAEDLVVRWRQSGFAFFKTQILQQILSTAHAFIDAQPAIDLLFKELEASFDPTTAELVRSKLTTLEAPVQAMADAIAAYDRQLAAFEKQMSVPYGQMNVSVAQIQAEEADLQQQIATITTQIGQLQQQVQADRDAIAKADARRTSGIFETIFGVALAPLTGGLSLILAGIGVGTIAEAQEQISSLQSTISDFQTQIVGEQTELTADQQQVATLGGISMTMGLVLSDITSIDAALDSLRIGWSVLFGEIVSAAASIQQATTSQEMVVAQIWFDAACASWVSILDFVAPLVVLPDPTATIVPVG